VFKLETAGELVGRSTSVAHARAMHLDETFAGLELFGLLYRVVFADFYGCSRLWDNGGGLDLWDRHRRGEASW
jgi:hypothetical protein